MLSVSIQSLKTGDTIYNVCIYLWSFKYKYFCEWERMEENMKYGEHSLGHICLHDFAWNKYLYW